MSEEQKPSAIEHSLHKDTVSISGEVIDNTPALSEEEAILLANIQARAASKRRAGMFRAMAVIVILAAVILFLVPTLFPATDATKEVVDIHISNELIVSDISYVLPIPEEAAFPGFRDKVFKSDVSFAELVVQSNGAPVVFKNLPPFINERFIKNLDTTVTGRYVYGLYTGDDKISHPFLVLEVSPNRDATEKALLVSERTLYSDLGVILQLSENTTIETKQFTTLQSIRNPLRKLVDDSGKEVLVYGFATDDILVFAPSEAVYAALKTRILTGY